MLKISKNLYYIYLKHFGKYFRLPSYPFTSGDTFRDYSNFIYDEIKNFNPINVSAGDKIFVKTDLIDKYFKHCHPKIKNKYYLITHNSDVNISNYYFKFLDDKIINWFAQNLEEKFSEKINIIPIGLENRWRMRNGKIKDFNRYMIKKNTKNIVVLSSFSTETNKNRKKVRKIINGSSFIKFAESVNPKKYRSLLSNSMFNICPEGNGLDTHRIWESLALEAIPIVLKNSFTEQYSRIGVPMLYLNSWNELIEFQEDDLINLYSKLTANNDLKKFSLFSFWKEYMESLNEK